MFKLHKNSFLMLIHERDTIKRWSCRLIFLKTSEPNNFLKFDSNYSHIFRSGQQLDPTRDVLRLHRSNLVQIFTFAWQPCWALSSIRHFTNSSILSGKVVQSVSNQNLLVDDGTNMFHGALHLKIQHKILRLSRFKPGSAWLEAQMLPLC